MKCRSDSYGDPNKPRILYASFKKLVIIKSVLQDALNELPLLFQKILPTQKLRGARLPPVSVV